jgi:N-formylglutamate deformylase
MSRSGECALSEQGWVVESQGRSPAFLFHVPHAGTHIPPDVRADIVLGDAELERELRLMTDWHTDEIARKVSRSCVVASTSFINQLSRVVVDPERLPDEVEPMAAIGMGAVYLATSDLGILRDPDGERDVHLRNQYFDPYATAVADLVDRLLEESGSVTIIDVHSYPERALPYERDPLASRPGVCIGVDDLHTPTALVEAAHSAFEGVLGDVGINSPFAGTYVPLRHYGRDDRVRSVMVEIRRDIYMNESTGELHAGIDDVVRRMSEFVRACAWIT